MYNNADYFIIYNVLKIIPSIGGAPASAAAEAIAAPVVPSIAFKEKRKILNKKKVTPW